MNRKGLLAVLVVFGGLFSVFFLCMVLVVGSLGDDLPHTGEGIGVVEIVGPIADTRETVRQIRRFQRDDNVKAIVLRIDSPGGAVAPSQEVYHAVLKARKDKKVYASMGSVAASGGYYIACAADEVYAMPGSVTGSIGVITQLTNFKELAELAKVDVITVKSGEYKDVGNPFREFNEKDRMFFEQMVMDIYDQFVEDIAAARKMKVEDVRALADGRVYTGKQAVKLGLVDKIGSFYDAAEALQNDAGLEGELNLIRPPKKRDDMWSGLLESSTEQIARGVLRGLRSESEPTLEYRYTGPK